MDDAILPECQKEVALRTASVTLIAQACPNIATLQWFHVDDDPTYSSWLRKLAKAPLEVRPEWRLLEMVKIAGHSGVELQNLFEPFMSAPRLKTLKTECLRAWNHNLKYPVTIFKRIPGSFWRTQLRKLISLRATLNRNSSVSYYKTFPGFDPCIMSMAPRQPLESGIKRLL